MKKLLILGLMIAVVISIGAFGIAANAGNVDAGKKVDFDNNLLLKHDIKLEQPDLNADVSSNISSQTAIEFAEKEFGLKPNSSADVGVTYTLMTNESFNAFSENALNKNPELKAKKHMDKLPVYIVQVKGTYFGSCPIGGTSPIFTEKNVVVDAKTGEVLMSFSY